MRVLTPLCLAAGVALFSPGAAVLAVEDAATQPHAAAARLVDADFVADTAARAAPALRLATPAQ